MTLTKLVAIVLLLFLLFYWKPLVLAIAGLAEDYELWAALKDRGVESRSFYRYWLDECW